MKTYDELLALIIQRGVHAEFGDAGEGWGIEQNPHELATFLVRMQELNVTSVLEIGTGYKGGLSRFLAADMGWQVTSVDINVYHHVFPGVRYAVGKDVTFPESFDLVFIDGDHRYEYVKYDYGFYGCGASKVIAFHDILGLRNCEGVAQLWDDQLSHNPNSFQVTDESQRASGIGWIEL